tara:strand:- start:559 stop:945 length:387 start_codon:yes stop_codon:yes gene_type:complete
MNPKKSKEFIQEISEDLNIDTDLVEDLVDFYYKECRDVLSNLKHIRLNIEGLGHFISRPNLIKKAISRYTKALSNHDTSTFAAYYNKKNLENKLELLKNTMKQHNLEKEKKENFKNNKDVKSKKNLEE